MYTQYFHFSELPFSIAPDPHFLYMSDRHQEGLAHLLYGINSGGGFIALTGEVGTGKTTLCHCLLHQLPDDVDIALILNPKLNSIELLANICDELDIHYAQESLGLKQLTDVLNKYLLDTHAQGRRTVLMIDEAQNLSLDVLEQVRLLTNLETPKAKLLQIVLVGQPELKQLLARKELRQLNQRITARYHLEPLSLQESRTYIKHRLSLAKGDTHIFKDSAVRKIYKISQGIPRLINILCDRSLLGAYSTGVQQVTSAIVNKAAQEALDSEAQGVTHIQLFFLLLLAVSLGLASLMFIDAPQQQVPAPPPLASKVQQPTLLNTPEPPTSVIPEVPKTAVPAPPPVVAEQHSPLLLANFSDFLNNTELSQPNALTQAFKLWAIKVENDPPINCQSVAEKGFRCLLGQGTLKEVLGLSRPTILEFQQTDHQKRYALLTAMQQGYPVLRGHQGKDIVFRLEDVLANWQGYYLIVWKPPFNDGMQGIYPQRSSPNVAWLRQVMDTIDNVQTDANQTSLFFDAQLEARVRSFQTKQHLTADGIAGSKTLIHLQNALDTSNAPKLEYTD